MFICVRFFFVFFRMCIDSSFKVVTGFVNITRIASCTHKRINQKRLQKIWCFIFSWETVINFKRSKNNFKVTVFVELFTDFWQLSLNLLWIFANVWKFLKTCFVIFWTRLVTITMCFVQRRLYNFVIQKKNSVLKFLWFWLHHYEN